MSISVSTRDEAIALARAFIAKAEACKPGRTCDHDPKTYRAIAGTERNSDYLEGGADVAAAKRASLDLTKALAKFRRGDR